MSTTIPNIDLGSDGEWFDLLAESGIAANLTVRVQNRGEGDVLIQFGTTQPVADSFDGVLLKPADTFRIELEPNVWAKALHRAYVNIAEAT